MTIKLNSLDRWKALETGAAIVFEKCASNSERRVRLHLNLERATTFFVENKHGPRFLTTLGAGLQTVEFGASGKLAVFAQDDSGQVQYQTAEDEPTFARVVDPVIFTKIANRRHRNPELEEMMHRMHLNMERRLAQQASEFGAALERRRKEEENGRPAERIETNAPGAAPSAGGAEVRPQEPHEPQSGADAGSADRGEQPGDG